MVVIGNICGLEIFVFREAIAVSSGGMKEISNETRKEKEDKGRDRYWMTGRKKGG